MVLTIAVMIWNYNSLTVHDNIKPAFKQEINFKEDKWKLETRISNLGVPNNSTKVHSPHEITMSSQGYSIINTSHHKSSCEKSYEKMNPEDNRNWRTEFQC